MPNRPGKVPVPKPSTDAPTTNRPRTGTTTKRGYGWVHQQHRKTRLELYPVCERCRAAWSHCAHHLRYPARDVNDYEALCAACHDLTHKEDR